MSVTDQLLENNEKYAAGFTGPLPLPPALQVAVLACMDARLDVHDLLGLDEGVRQSIGRIKASPFVPHTGQVRGFVFDVATGRLAEVS